MITYDQIREIESKINLKKLVSRFWSLDIPTDSDYLLSIECLFCNSTLRTGRLTLENYCCLCCECCLGPLEFMMHWHKASFEDVLRYLEGWSRSTIHFKALHEREEETVQYSPQVFEELRNNYLQCIWKYPKENKNNEVRC